MAIYFFLPFNEYESPRHKLAATPQTGGNTKSGGITYLSGFSHHLPLAYNQTLYWPQRHNLASSPKTGGITQKWFIPYFGYYLGFGSSDLLRFW